MGNASSSPPWEGALLLEFVRPGKAARKIQLLVASSWTVQQLRAAAARLLDVPDAGALTLRWNGRRVKHSDFMQTLAECGISQGDVVVAELNEWTGRLHIASADDLHLRVAVAVASHYTVAQLLFAIHCKIGVPAGALALMYFRRGDDEDGKGGAWELLTPPRPSATVAAGLAAAAAVSHLASPTQRGGGGGGGGGPPDPAEFKFTLAELGLQPEATLRMAIEPSVLASLSPTALERLAAAMGGGSAPSPGGSGSGGGIGGGVPYGSLKEIVNDRVGVNASAGPTTTVTSDLLQEWQREHGDAAMLGALAVGGGEGGGSSRTGGRRPVSLSPMSRGRAPFSSLSSSSSVVEGTADGSASAAGGEPSVGTDFLAAPGRPQSSSSTSSSSQLRAGHPRPQSQQRLPGATVVAAMMSPGEARALARGK